MIPTNRVLFRKRVKSGTDAFGDDIFTDATFEISGVILAPANTRDLPEPRENLDDIYAEIHLPKNFTERVSNSSMEVLDGPFAGMIFEIEGDSIPYAFSPLQWNRKLIGRELRRG